jgi:two-component system, chemotaxis family, protein-glutamate methylesterase/glutaminase
MRPIRILIVDDSAFIRYALSKRLDAEPDLTVIDTASDGIDALAKIARLQPDVVTLDIEMPRLSGLDALRQIMAQHPRPVIMLSTLTQEGARETFQALALGAVDFVPKPTTTIHIQHVFDTLKDKIRSVANVPTLRLQHLRQASLSATPPPASAVARPLSARDVVLVIGSSTGGPQALQRVVSDLPADLPAALAIVQHMPPQFTATLAERLNAHSAFAIRESDGTETLRVGQGLLAPGGYHLVLHRGGVSLSSTPPRNHVRPSVDVTFESAADAFGRATVAVILTGMGSDGTEGARRIKAAGGKVLAEAEETCVVYGMPKSAAEAGLVDALVPLDEMPRAVTQMVHGARERL